MADVDMIQTDGVAAAPVVEEIPITQEVDFFTFGMIIIDEIHFLPPKQPLFDIFGGAGSYATMGARLLSSPPLSHTVSWIVDQGSDFPPHLDTQIRSWETSCLIRHDSSRLTTRAWNGYDEHEKRNFKYTTPKLRLEAHELNPPLLFSKSFHMACSPDRCIELTTTILRRRKAADPSLERPLFIWEPIPDSCAPSELLKLTNALPYVDICSPNHAELAAFMSDPDQGNDPATGEISTTSVERACEQLLSGMPLQTYALVIRCAHKGCYIAKNGGRSRRPSQRGRKKRPANHMRGGLTLDMDMEALFKDVETNDEGRIERVEVEVDPGTELWLPAYHDSVEGQKKVVDPTGAGNAFLGGMAVAMARGVPLKEAAVWGSVVASFAIEQVAMPVLGSDELGREMWNGVSVEQRLGEFRKRVGL